MSDYEFYSKDDEIEYKKNELKKNYVIAGSMIIIAGVLGVALPVGLVSCINSATYINWGTLKESSIVATRDDKMINYHIISNNENNKYHDIINNYDINPDTIVYTVDTASYLVNIDGVKNRYSKGELKEILKQFSMNQEYTVSDETVKVLVKEK